MNEKPPLRTYLLILALCSLGLLSSDMFLPSLPSLTAYFSETTARVQLTLSVFLLGLAVPQIFVGTLSDTYGRWRVLAWALALYTLATVGCCFATSVPMLVGFRFFQAMGACAGLVIGRAVVADRYGAVGGARMLSVVFPFVAMSPAVAPIVGGYLETAFGWRGSFVCLCVYGAVLLAVAVRMLMVEPTSAPRGERPPTTHLRNMGEMLRHPGYLAYVIAIACAYGAYFGYVSASPFILRRMGIGAVLTGYTYLSLAAPFIISALIGRRLARKVPLVSLVRIGILLTTTGAALLASLAATGATGLVSLFLPLIVLALGNGLILPFGSAAAVALFPGKTGTASGLVGTVQLGTSALVATLAGRVNDGRLLPVALVVVGVASIGLVGFFVALMRSSRPVAAVSGQAG